MLDQPLASVTTETVDGPNGTIVTRTVEPVGWTFDTIGRVAKTMFELASWQTRRSEADKAPRLRVTSDLEREGR